MTFPAAAVPSGQHTMDVANAFAFTVFISYFLIIAALFWIILRSLPLPHPSTNKLKVLTFGGLALGSLVHTWFCMFSTLIYILETPIDDVFL